MRGLFALVCVALLSASSVHSNTIRRYRQLDAAVPVPVAVEEVKTVEDVAVPNVKTVEDIIIPKDQIPVQIVEVEPVVLVQPLESLRKVDVIPAVEEPFAISNEILPENVPVSIPEDVRSIPVILVEEPAKTVEEPVQVKAVAEEVEQLRSTVAEVQVPVQEPVKEEEQIILVPLVPVEEARSAEVLEEIKELPKEELAPETESVADEKKIEEVKAIPEILVASQPEEQILVAEQTRSVVPEVDLVPVATIQAPENTDHLRALIKEEAQPAEAAALAPVDALPEKELTPAEPAKEEIPQVRQSNNVPAADPTTAKPQTQQPGFIQQIVQGTPLGQFFSNGQPQADAAAPTTAPPNLFQNLLNQTSQFTANIQQGFQQQLQNIQTAFNIPGAQQQAQNDAVDADPAPTTARPQGPFQNIVSTFLGQQQDGQPAAPAQGPLQGILNLFNGGNRVSTPTPAPATAAPDASAAIAADPAPEASPIDDKIDAARSSQEEVELDPVQETSDEVKPGEIVVREDITV